MSTPAESAGEREDLLGVVRRPLPNVEIKRDTPRRITSRSIGDAAPIPPDTGGDAPTPRHTQTTNVTPISSGAKARTPGEQAAAERNAKSEELNLEARRRQTEMLRNALGPLERLLKKPTVSDILRNPNGKIFVIETGVPKYEITDYTMSDEQALQLIGAVARYKNNAQVDAAHPTLEAILPDDGSRFTAVIPPATFPGPAIAIRKHAMMLRTLDDYVDQGALNSRELVTIRKSIQARDNILIVGATGSGKTTFANAVLNEMAQNAPERFIIIEDNRELQCPASDVLPLMATPDLTMNDLLRSVLRFSPDRICVGEVRGAEAHVLLKAWNTGHKGGLTTIHAESVARGLVRLEECVEEANVPIKRSRIAQAIQLVVVIVKNDIGERKVTEIRRIAGGDDVTGYRFET
jgi:type IV secretion system protein VirB11